MTRPLKDVYKRQDDMYKLDLISNLEDGNITVYDKGDFTDLCRGPHVDNTKLCKNFKLVKHSGVYWKGDANNHVMHRNHWPHCNAIPDAA